LSEPIPVKPESKINFKKAQNVNPNTEKITSVMLNGKNFNMWARQATFGLVGRDRFEFVNGDITMSVPAATGSLTAEEKVTIREWRKRDNQVVGWLLATMEPHVAKIMTYQGTTQDMWEKAEKMYGKKKKYSYIYQLQQEIQQIKQQPNQSVSELFSLLQEKLDEVKLYRPPTSDLEEIQLREEQDEVFRFLASLDPSYEAVIS
jgi:gag-polypeptide of LTR copia-type